jgi:hypothetical protein
MKKWLFFLILLFSILHTEAQKHDIPKLQATYDAIKEAGIRHPEIVMAQCMQETGWLGCKKCCLRFHNLFGFYVNGNKCKKFESDAASIAYYKSWQDKRYYKWKAKYPKADYYHFLKYVQYATSETYNKELKPKVAWIKKNLKL